MEAEKKTEIVYDVFQCIAPGYDRANQRISLFHQKRWKRMLVRSICRKLPAGSSVLDVCCGTGDIAAGLLQQRKDIRVSGIDFSPAMLRAAREKKELSGVSLVLGDAMNMPFASGTFDVAVISFGLRNTADYRRTLAEMQRVTKPGGYIFCMDSMVPEKKWVRPFYRIYFKHLMPFLGGGLKNRRRYQWLSESTENFLSSSQLRQLFYKAGCRHVASKSFMFGACVMLRGRIDHRYSREKK